MSDIIKAITKDKKIINEKNFFDFFKSLRYGQNFAEFDNPCLLKSFEYVNTLNSVWPGIIEIKPAVVDDIVDGDYESVEIEGLWAVKWMNRGLDPKEFVVSDSEIYLWEAASEALKGKKIISFAIRDEFFKKAKKYANKLGIKFVSDANGQGFDAREKAKSVYARIRQAHAGGLDSIEFDESEASAPTIRVYVSGMNSGPEKFSVSTIGGKITVYFKKPTPEDTAKKKTLHFFASLQYEIGLERSIEVFREVASEKEWDTVVVSDKSDIDTEEADRSLFEDNSPIEYHSIIAKEQKEKRIHEDDGSDFFFEDEKPAHAAQSPEKPKAIFYKIDPEEPEPGSHLVEDEDFDPDEFGGYWKTIDGKRVYIDPADPNTGILEVAPETPIREVEGLKQYYIPELEKSPSEAKETAEKDDFEDDDF